MRTLGLLSSFSGRTHEFYLRALHEGVRLRSGDEREAKLVALGFNPSTRLLVDEKWWTLVRRIKHHIRELASAGAEAVLLTSLVWYRFFDELAESGSIPVLHPVDALVHGLPPPDIESGPLGLLAPELVIYGGRLVERFRVGTQREIILPAQADVMAVLDSGETAFGAGLAENRQKMQRVLDGLRLAGATGIIVGTPEIAGLIAPEELERDCYHLPALQVAFAAEWMLRRSRETLF